MSIFAYADLQRSRFNGSDLQKASFWQANLQGCDLRHAKLQGAVLTGANLQGTDLTNAEFDHKTQLPDHNPGVNDSFYQPDTDMARFTDSNHPNFWRSDWSKSPAYRGNDDD
jgi:uncharacterized protein YjbI with pentapeptide repeats